MLEEAVKSIRINTLDLPPPSFSRTDPRDAKAGYVVSDLNGYYDSQNIVAVGGRDESSRVYSVILHHSHNHEGGSGLRLYGTRSIDYGKTWSALTPIEESLTRQSHDGYQLVHRLPNGSERIYVFYGYNEGENSFVKNKGGQSTEVSLARTDMQAKEGYYFRFSDDQAQTWSPERYLIPIRRTRIDRDNPWNGKVIGMFMCDKPTVINGAVYFAFQKTRDGAGETPGSEVFFLRSKNLLSVIDPKDADWETLPRGDVGLQAPAGQLQLGEEPHVLQVSDAEPKRLFCLWRTEVGRLACAYSSQDGEIWQPPFWMTYEGRSLEDGGVQELRNPRGAITPMRFRHRTPDGKSEFALLFYNNGHTERLGYCGRQVVWLTVGRETDAGLIRWTQPEIVLWWDGIFLDDREDWNPDWAIVDGPGYADWLEEEDGRICFVESNKLAVRFHEVEPRLIKLLRHQSELRGVPLENKVLELKTGDSSLDQATVRGPILPDLRAGGGFTLIVRVQGANDSVKAGQVLISAMSEVTAALDEISDGKTITKGYEVVVASDSELELRVTNGIGSSFRVSSSDLPNQTLWDNQPHVIGFIVDGGPKVASVVVDERLCDGGEAAAQGWTFISRELGEIGGASIRVTPSFHGVLSAYLIYDRALLTSEVMSASKTLRAELALGS